MKNVRDFTRQRGQGQSRQTDKGTDRSTEACKYRVRARTQWVPSSLKARNESRLPLSLSTPRSGKPNKDFICPGSQIWGKKGRNVHLLGACSAPGPSCVYTKRFPGQARGGAAPPSADQRPRAQGSAASRSLLSTSQPASSSLPHSKAPGAVSNL